MTMSENILNREIATLEKKGFHPLTGERPNLSNFNNLEITYMEYNHPILTETELTNMYMLSTPRYTMAELKAKIKNAVSGNSKYKFLQYKTSNDLYLFVVGNSSRYGRTDMLIRFH